MIGVKLGLNGDFKCKYKQLDLTIFIAKSNCFT